MNKNFNPYDDPMFGGDPDKAKAEVKAKVEAEAKSRPKGPENGKAEAGAEEWDLTPDEPLEEWDLGPDDDVKLPEPGDYQGTITARTYEKQDVIGIIVEHRLLGHPAVNVENSVRQLKYRKNAANPKDTSEGLRFFNRLGKAIGVDSSTIRNPAAIPRIFNSRQVTLTVAHLPKDGVTTLVVRSYAPAKTE